MQILTRITDCDKRLKNMPRIDFVLLGEGLP